MNGTRKKLKKIILALCLTALPPLAAFAQTVPPATPGKPGVGVKVTPAVKVFKPRGKVFRSEHQDSEKSIAVDGKVNVYLPCVIEGNVKINGWDRSEVRVFVKDGSRVGINVAQKDKKTGNPVWIVVTRAEPSENEREQSECIYGEEIEIDVPRMASINVKGQETITRINSVRKASVKNIGGDISLRNIAEGVEATTYEGDVTVEDSSGAFNLESATGNIVAFEIAPSEIGDVFKAKTNNGAISLQSLEHRQIEVNSISGAISFNGEFLSGGLYNFGTSNGLINLTIPADSSCKIAASYGFGGFRSEIPVTKVTENKYPGGQNIVATMGKGTATLNLTTASGAIRIVKK